MRIVILLLGLLLITSSAYCESYLVIDKKTKEVKSLSPEDDCILKDGWEKIVLPMDYGEIELEHHPTYYYYKGKKFILNIKKLSDEEIAKQQIEEKKREEAFVRDKMRELAIEKLREEGHEFKYIDK